MLYATIDYLRLVLISIHSSQGIKGEPTRDAFQKQCFLWEKGASVGADFSSHAQKSTIRITEREKSNSSHFYTAPFTFFTITCTNIQHSIVTKVSSNFSKSTNLTSGHRRL